jgi:hypothetical protein
MLRRLTCFCETTSSIGCSTICGEALVIATARRWARMRTTKKSRVSNVDHDDHDGTGITFAPSGFASPSLRPAGSQPVVGGFVAADTPSISALRADIDAMRKERTFAEHVRKAQQASKAEAVETQRHPLRVMDTVLPVTSPSYNLRDGHVGDAIRASDWLLNQRAERDITDVLRKKKTATSSMSSREHSLKLARLAGIVRSPSDISANCDAVTSLSEAVQAALARYDTKSALLGDYSSKDPVYLAALLDVILAASHAELKQWLALGVIDPLWWDDVQIEAPPGDRMSVAERAGTTTETTDLDDDPLQVALAASRVGAYVRAVTQSITYGDVPPPDVATAVLKAERGAFGDVSEKELRALEVFEDSNSRALGRSFAPSSPVLAELGKLDKKVQSSLEVLECVKRNTLLDKDFQDAVEYVNALHEGRQTSRERVRSSQRSSSTEVPYFFGSSRSRLPPAADMNLPEPAPSREEKMRMQRKKKLKQLRQRYSK